MSVRYDRAMTQANLAVTLSSIAFVMVTMSARTPSWAAAQTSTQTSSAPQDKLPDGPGKSVFVKVCGDCHAPESAVSVLRSREEWTLTLNDMAQRGAQGTDQEFDQILDYLVGNFSPIQVNKASATDLESTLGVSTAVAEAIVGYRQENGNFKTVDDLKKVPGVDAAKIDNRKDRLVF